MTRLVVAQWDVRLSDPVLGIGKKLGRVKARCLAEADILATIEFKNQLQRGQRALVSPAGVPRRRLPRRKP